MFQLPPLDTSSPRHKGRKLLHHCVLFLFLFVRRMTVFCCLVAARTWTPTTMRRITVKKRGSITTLLPPVAGMIPQTAMSRLPTCAQTVTPRTTVTRAPMSTAGTALCHPPCLFESAQEKKKPPCPPPPLCVSECRCVDVCACGSSWSVEWNFLQAQMRKKQLFANVNLLFLPMNEF